MPRYVDTKNLHCRRHGGVIGGGKYMQKTLAGEHNGIRDAESRRLCLRCRPMADGGKWVWQRHYDIALAIVRTSIRRSQDCSDLSRMSGGSQNWYFHFTRCSTAMAW
jgi:hypothetical protein